MMAQFRAVVRQFDALGRVIPLGERSTNWWWASCCTWAGSRLRSNWWSRRELQTYGPLIRDRRGSIRGRPDRWAPL